MAENLNFKTGKSWCYDDKESNCNKYGRLYDWNTAMAGSSSSTLNPSGVQGVCPADWHLPSRGEWNDLMTAVGGSSTAGKKLKSQTGWDSYSGISSTDDYGFSALPGGYRGTGGYFYNAGSSGYWWSAKEDGSGYAYFRGMGYDYDNVYEDYGSKDSGFSVRCLKND
jgi:uncharacterized protein (TIGR02145 family)